ncbi:MATE family efflux transporter [Irregularibacter muris]|uniref:Probable multidrug resistance protein NorM n=1 Tax=Irregularibacter muris TaxID=1796619 RepID=A0AAE3L3Y8_9FIRM|nr:MATE family efflux transporter [Irregularibacter muris]MCR1899088.1 MATE family efflux transporter [Irregularibacter muris]
MTQFMMDHSQKVKQILHLAWPAVLEMMLNMMVWVFDTAMIGKGVGAIAVTATSLSSQMVYTVLNILGAIGIGAAAIIARYYGAKEFHKAEKTAAQALKLSLIISIVVCSLGWIFAEKILIAVNAEGEVVRLGTQYMKIVLWGFLFAIPTTVISGIIRGAGNTKAPLVVAAVINIINLVGDYVLIFGKFGFPKMGVQGAAIATAGALIIGGILSLLIILSGKIRIKVHMKDLKTWNFENLKQLLKLSLPAGGQELMDNGSRLLSSFIIIQLGTIPFAANQVAVSAESISFMPGYGFSIAATTLVGQSLGAGNKKEAEKNGWIAAILTVILMGAIGLIFFFIPHILMSFFTDHAEARQLGALCLKVAAFEQITIGLAMVLSGALRGAGDTRGPFLISAITNWGVRIPLIILVVFVLKLSVVYVWVVTAIQFVVESSLLFFRFKRGKWKEIEIR